jgi:hypothetical protein
LLLWKYTSFQPKADPPLAEIFNPTTLILNLMKTEKVENQKKDKTKDKNDSLSDAEKEEAIKKLEESLEDCC